MKRIAIINQRYGFEVNGGSEYYTRLIAERLNDRYQVDVLTTCALDYSTWENFYPEGTQKVGEVTVKRFPVKRIRRKLQFRIISKVVSSMPCHISWLENYWIKKQGPFCPELVQYIIENKNEYDAFIFVTYLYYTTACAITQVADKSILIPTAHDEPYIYFKTYKKIFQKPKAIVYLTEEEKGFVNELFHNQKIHHKVLGIGVDIPTVLNVEQFRRKFQIKENYVIYVGRVDESKNCKNMIDDFISYKKAYPGELKLLIIGKSLMDLPACSEIKYLGFVEEEDKFNAIAGARALIMPSKYESLSISVLEAFAIGVPVLVNGWCEVLKAHCIKSNAGYYYTNQVEFWDALNELQRDNSSYNQMCINAKKYVENNYQWTGIMDAYQELIELKN